MVEATVDVAFVVNTTLREYLARIRVRDER
jgi:hypothetical protein